jgi:hypothetical protein
VTPPSLDFGTIAVGEIKDKTITITNTGGGILDVTGTASVAPFTCIPPGCSGALGAGLSQTATIRLTAPATPGAPSEIIRVNSSNAGFKDVPVFGNVIPVISINPGPLDFGSVILKKCSVDKALTINNNSSTVTVPAGSISVAAPFSCATSCDYPAIPPGGSSVIMMRYCPTALGAQTGVGTLSTGIQDNTGNLQGTGLPLTFKVIEK